ncbi:unnamed protein product [Didymodactylos carnosus]|uniref:Dynamin N-terminal domain-containing protein n=1 Tax=Didymodactylos carnosus TaxID=1234261 RepID=A0A815HEX4_9BILA|nr:unnamed protein product [Didymodactylos carnosus]CAF4221704.1 unnamed protein product [Didymodactylos carnosus]
MSFLLLVVRWTQHLLTEFHGLKHQFKRILEKKFENQELNINADLNNKTRMLYNHMKQLEQTLQTVLSKKSFDELQSYLTKIDHSTDVNELKQKINDLIDTYIKIIESLEYVEQQQEEIDRNSNRLVSIKNILERLKELNAKVSHTICIIGLEKCGKSTYINALLGYDLLPSDSKRCTQIRTILKPPMRDNPNLFATAKFYNDSEFGNLLEQMKRKDDESDENFQLRKKQIMELRSTIVSKYPEGEQRFNTGSGGGGSVNAGGERKQVSEYIVGESYVNIIKELTIFTDKLPGKNYELLDVPGFDSPIKEHRLAGLQAIKSSDAFLYLTDGQRPDLTEPQMVLLNEIQGENHYEAMQRAFGIITKLDLCQTQTKFNDHFLKARDQLIEKKFKKEHIFAICSVLQLLKQNSEEFTVIQDKIKNFGELENGFQKSKTALSQFIECELPKTHLKQLVDLAKNELLRYVTDTLKTARKILPINPTEETSIDTYIKKLNTEKWDQVYEEERFQPTFAKANFWQKTQLTENRSKFIDETKRIFHDRFRALAMEAPEQRPQRSIKRLMFETYGFTPLHPNSHPPEDKIREKLCFELEKVVLRTSNELTQHFYDNYVCKLVKILNEICPEDNGLYETTLSLEICKIETRTLVTRVCGPVIAATLRFSQSDAKCRQAAVDELILVAPTVAYNLCENNNSNDGTNSGSGIMATFSSLAPTLVKGIELGLGIFGRTGIQNRLTAEVVKMIFRRII